MNATSTGMVKRFMSSAMKGTLPLSRPTTTGMLPLAR